MVNLGYGINIRDFAIYKLDMNKLILISIYNIAIYELPSHNERDTNRRDQCQRTDGNVTQSYSY